MKEKKPIQMGVWDHLHCFLAGLMVVMSVFLLAGSASATADQTRAAVTCVPDDDTIPERYLASYTTGSISFQGTATGSLYFYCPFTNPKDSGNPDWNALFLTSYDPGPNSYVEAKLYRKQRSTGANYLVGTVKSTDGANVKEEWALFSGLNFDENAYWVRVRLYRSVSTESPVFHAVTLGFMLY